MKIDVNLLKTLAMAPGAMSYRFINGRQVSLLTFVVIFFITNLIFFVVPPQSDLYAQVNNMPYSSIAKEMVEKKIRKNRTNQKKFEARYETRSWIVSKVILVSSVFYFSIALFVINYRRTLKYTDHLAVSFEFWTLSVLYVLVILFWVDSLIVTLLASAILLYVFERNAYKQRIPKAMTNAALLVFCFYAVLLAYHASVFFFTMLTL